MSAQGAAGHVYDAVPLRPFHLRVTVASFGGVFSDGFGLGIIGVALTQATPQLALTPLWLGLLGAAALAGLFLGALLTGPAADRFGRRPIFGFNMLALGLLSALQFVVDSPAQLLVLRLLIGILLGTDYVVSKALLTEFTPSAFRGRIMSTLSIAWAGGYTCAYFVGYLLHDSGAEAWRWMLASSAVPCIAIFVLRWRLPESPLWLVARGRAAEAARVVARHVGTDVQPPAAAAATAASHGQWSELFRPRWARNTAVGCVFFTAQVIPYFAVGTFVTDVLAALHVTDGFVGGLVYNAALLCGALLGLLTIDRMPRRVFLVGSFAVTAGALLVMLTPLASSAAAIVVSFAVFAGVLSAASNLCYVYLPELFPTSLRASGIGLAIAASRIGSAVSTFLLPIVVARFGVQSALGACVAVLAVGGLLCYAWAPETRHQPLAQ